MPYYNVQFIKNPYIRGICCKCGQWYDNRNIIENIYHLEAKEICMNCRYKRAVLYLNITTGSWEPCRKCINWGYSLDSRFGEHGRCFECINEDA